jgi:DNA-binding CsgD family transcriptional regulator/PAS domain-containing protein
MRQLREIAARLEEAPADAAALQSVVEQLPRLLRADSACALLVRGRQLVFFLEKDMPAGIGRAFQKWLPRAPRHFAYYDPDRPDPRQRNVALRSADLSALTGGRTPAVVRSFLPRFALSECDQLRVLVCEGPSLLAWVGAFRARPFTRAEADVLDALVPALQRRLAFERRVAEARARGAEMGRALEGVPAAAFVIGKAAAVLHANEAGRALLERERETVADRLRATLRGQASGVQMARLSSELPDLRLAIVQPSAADPGPRVAVARVRWGLTPRQAEVLHLIAQGMSNRAVAAPLGCSEGTVELHVTSLLHKAECESRAQLIARLWTTI